LDFPTPESPMTTTAEGNAHRTRSAHASERRAVGIRARRAQFSSRQFSSRRGQLTF